MIGKGDVMDYYSGSPEPSDLDYENGNQGSSGENIFDFFRKNSFLILVILAALIAILIVIFLLTSGGKAPDYETKDKDSYLSELYVSDGTMEPMFAPDVFKYKITSDSEYVTFECEARSEKAKVEGCDGEGVMVDEKKPVSYDIKVTAEDGNITRYRFTIEKADHFDDGY